MRGEEMWEQGLYGDYVAPHLGFAPAAGRFALSRILIRGSAVPDQPISADEVTAQTVIVYQTNTGKQLLRADCSPVERAGQNFAFSPDGLSLAVVHADAIEIYPLPPLTSKDQADLKLAQSSAPPETDLPVHFGNQPEIPPQTPPSNPTSNPPLRPNPSPPQPPPTPQPNLTRNPPATLAHAEAPATTMQAEQPDLKTPHSDRSAHPPSPSLNPPPTPTPASTEPLPPSTPPTTKTNPPPPRKPLPNRKKGQPAVTRSQPVSKSKTLT